MATIDLTRPTFTVIVTLDVRADRKQDVLDLVTSRTDDYIRYLPGFVSASWLTRYPLNPADEDASGTQRIVEFLQWRHRADFEAFITDPVKSAHVATVSGLVEAQAFESYQLDAVITADGADRISITPGESDVVTGVMLIEPVPGKQGWINEYNQSETHRLIRHYDGFVSANFLLGRQTHRVTEYVQWASREAFLAAYSDERFMEHIHVVGHYATVDWGFYDVYRTIDAPQRVPALG